MKFENLTLEDVSSWNLPPVIVYAVPVMLFFVVLEMILARRDAKTRYEKKEFWASVGVGAGNLVVSALTKTFSFLVILYFYNITPLRIPFTWWAWVLCFIFVDFCRYWAHRIAHTNWFFWATHVTHHSSENYNLLVSFRLSWIQLFKLIFFVPIAMVGFHPYIFFFCHQIAVLYQFWIHTEYIKKLHPVIEFIFVTPSHHRVHHGRNPEYIDKNFGSSLIIWDRLFGTFKPEGERSDYGITKPIKSFNPVYLVFHEFVDLINAIRKTPGLKEKARILLGPPK